MTEVTKREQLAQLMQEMEKDQATALNEFHQLLLSADMDTLIKRFTDIRERVIPGTLHDQILSSTLNVLNSNRDSAQKLAEQAAEETKPAA